MNRIQHILLAIIFVAIAAKVSFLPAPKHEVAALSTDAKLEYARDFFKYKVHHIQTEPTFNAKSCMVKTSVCCHI